MKTHNVRIAFGLAAAFGCTGILAVNVYKEMSREKTVHANTIEVHCKKPKPFTITFNNMDVTYIDGKAVSMKYAGRRTRTPVGEGCEVRVLP